MKKIKPVISYYGSKFRLLELKENDKFLDMYSKWTKLGKKEVLSIGSVNNENKKQVLKEWYTNCNK